MLLVLTCSVRKLGLKMRVSKRASAAIVVSAVRSKAIIDVVRTLNIIVTVVYLLLILLSRMRMASAMYSEQGLWQIIFPVVFTGALLRSSRQ